LTSVHSRTPGVISTKINIHITYNLVFEVAELISDSPNTIKVVRSVWSWAACKYVSLYSNYFQSLTLSNSSSKSSRVQAENDFYVPSNPLQPFLFFMKLNYR
ncbi:hypothetical protein L9F63_025354, partial [Diploptera punctata]